MIGRSSRFIPDGVIGDVEDTVEGGDRRQAGGEVALDVRVVDVDVVGDDGDLTAGLCEVVELFGHRPDSVEVPARKSVDSTENAERPMVAVAISNANHDRMTARRWRTTKRPSRAITPPSERTTGRPGQRPVRCWHRSPAPGAAV
jgi:hypothetical protein